MENKKTWFYIVVVLAGILIMAWLVFYGPAYRPVFGPEEQTQGQVLQDMTTAPNIEVQPVPKEILRDLTAPRQEKHVSPDVLKSLTAPQ